MEKVKVDFELDRYRQQNFLYPLLFQEYTYALAHDHRSLFVENGDVDYNNRLSFVLRKRLMKQMYQENDFLFFSKDSNTNLFLGYNKNLYSQMLSDSFSVILEIFFSLKVESFFERKEKEIVKFHNLRSIHSLFPFLEDQFVHLTYVSDIELIPPIHLERVVQTLRYWIKDASSLHLVRLFIYKYSSWNSLITFKKSIKRNQRFFFFLYNYYVWEYESLLYFLRNQSFHLRSIFFGVLFERIYFYGKIKKIFVEVFSNDFQTKLWLFKDPLMHYVRYQGKAVLASKGTPLLMSKWKYYLLNVWQCHFYVWVQPGRVQINQLSNNPLHFMGYFSNMEFNLSVVRSQLLDNSFLINNATKQLDILVPILSLISYLAKAKFCNGFGHPISKPAWTESSDSDIIDRFVWICRNISHYYYSGSSKKNSFSRIKYILRLSCARTLARKHKSTVRACLKKLGSDLLDEFLMEDEQVLALIVPRVRDISYSLDRGRAWYLDIISLHNIINNELFFMN